MGVHQGVTTVELDVSSFGLPSISTPPSLFCLGVCSSPALLDPAIQNLAAETAAYLTTKHPDYAILAARIASKLLQPFLLSSTS
jgi:hypothetical protein